MTSVWTPQPWLGKEPLNNFGSATSSYKAELKLQMERIETQMEEPGFFQNPEAQERL